jgi:hypothetical protein
MALSKTARIAAFLVIAGFGLLARGAAAETVWVHPDRDPFAGTLDDALSLFAARGIPRQILDEQRRMYVSGRCTRRRIGDGERIDLMTSGRNQVLPDVVAAVSLWPDWAPRRATVCRAGTAQKMEYALLRPDVCGNWSEEELPSQAASPAPASPTALDEPRAIPGVLPGAVGVSDIAGGSGEFLEPAGFALPTILPDAPAGDFAPGPVPLDSPGPQPMPDSPRPPANVPEPASGFLLGSALAALVLVKRAPARRDRSSPPNENDKRAEPCGTVRNREIRPARGTAAPGAEG